MAYKCTKFMLDCHLKVCNQNKDIGSGKYSVLTSTLTFFVTQNVFTPL